MRQAFFVENLFGFRRKSFRYVENVHILPHISVNSQNALTITKSIPSRRRKSVDYYVYPLS